MALRQSDGFEFSGTTNKCDSSAVQATSTDVGLIIGGGLAFEVSGKSFTLGAGYDHSLAKFEDGFDVKHRVISLLGTLEFPWAK